MFYAHFVLSKRGPLARIWLAAHWDKKLTKAHVFETNLEASVETIISPQVKMALRTSGHLLLGVVRIYNRKAKYLLADCNEAFVKIKMAFRPGVVDLPEDNREAQHNQIYLVEEFHDFDAPLPDISEININRNLTLNQSRIEEITMPEDIPTSFQMDEGFGGGMMGFGKEVDQFTRGDLQDMFYKDDNRKLSDPKGGLGFSMDDGGLKDGFSTDMGEGGMLGDNFMQGPGLFGEGEENFFDVPGQKQAEIEGMETEGAMDNQVLSPAMIQQQQQEEQQKEIDQLGTIDAQHLQISEPAIASSVQVTQEPQPQVEAVVEPPPQQEEDQNVTLRNETTLIANEEEAFALEPLDITGVKDTRIRRKRKLVVDQIMELDGQTMREQLKDFSDIVSRMDMAPPTKRLMMSKEMGAVEKLFSHPTILLEDFVNKLFQINLHSSIPEDLLDVSNTQLQQQYGMLEDESKAEESSIQAARGDITGDQNAPDLLERSSVAQQKDVDSVVPPVDSNQVQPPGYNSDDDYEPYSVGPPSPDSSAGDNMPPPTTTPPRAPEPPSMTDLGDISQDISGLPLPTSEEPHVGGEPFEDLLEPSMTGEEESESYNDDVDDLRWNKRTQHLMHLLHRSYKHQDELSFFQMTEGVGRKQAVSKFYSLLVLAKQEACLLHQSESFSDVFIKKGPRFESVLM